MSNERLLSAANLLSLAIAYKYLVIFSFFIFDSLYSFYFLSEIH